MANKYRLYLKLLKRLKRYALSYKCNVNKKNKIYIRQRKEKNKEQKKIKLMFKGLGIEKEMISCLIMTALN